MKNIGIFVILLWMIRSSVSTIPACKCIKINTVTGLPEFCCPPHSRVVPPPLIVTCNCVRRNPKTGELESCCPPNTIPPIV